MDDKGHSGEITGGNKEHPTGKWRKGDLCHKLSEALGKLCLRLVFSRRQNLQAMKLDI